MVGPSVVVVAEDVLAVDTVVTSRCVGTADEGDVASVPGVGVESVAADLKPFTILKVFVCVNVLNN